jgi:peptidyl-tRNA hydrolase
MNTNTKYWSLTWDTNIKQKKLPDEEALLGFFDRVADECVFQYEKGEKKKKEHVQGTFTLTGQRKSKTNVLKLFEATFKNISGLTLSPVYDKVAINSYVTKSQGRTRGPFYGGKKEMHDKEMGAAKLRLWQQQLFEIVTGPEQESLKDRKVIWVQDACGNTGKSWFQKWLRIGQKKLTVRSLPVSSVDRLISAVNIINKTHKVDAFTIDLTRTQGEDQSYKDLFSTIEQIKNGYVIDVMYGKYNEAIFKPPLIIIFTNNNYGEFKHYLSEDRWKVYTISPDGDLAETHSPYEHVRVADIRKNIKGPEKPEPTFKGFADLEQKWIEEITKNPQDS